MTAAIEVSPADYARHAGVTRQAVGKMMDAGKIPFRRDAAGKPLIDMVAADVARGANTARLDEPPDDDDRAPIAPTQSPESSGLTKARTDTEQYRALRAKLEYEQLVGKLTPTDDVTAAAVKCNAAILDALRGLRQWAEPLANAAAKQGLDGVRGELRKMERELRNGMAAAFAKMVEGVKNGEPADEAELADDEIAEDQVAA